MKQINHFIVVFLFFVSCKSTTENTETIITPKTPVEVVNIQTGTINQDIVVYGTTQYLKRNIITSPIPAFIREVNIKLGDKVNKGDVLYVIQSKESKAVANNISQIDSTLKNFGIIKITAPSSGIITTFDKQQVGDYVLEGTQLCTIAESKDLLVQVNVPYEYTHDIKLGSSCFISLPDSTTYLATLTQSLATMNSTVQTQLFFAQFIQPILIPEGMNVLVKFKKPSISVQQILPKSCVLSDEMMKEFWIMKLVTDTIAIKVPVQVGKSNSEFIEILAPKFNKEDKIISNGNYGLSDTAYVYILKNKK